MEQFDKPGFERVRYMKKVFVIIVVTVALICCSVLIAAPIVNDHVAKKTAKELADLPLPNNTELLESVYKAGKLVGNGNGMQYFGAILIQSELTLNELKEFYLNNSNCKVKQQTTTEIGIIEHANLAFQTDINEDNYYIVYSWGTNSGIFHELDLRGH